MRKDDVELILRYLHRFMEGPLFSRQKFASLFRYIGLACSLLAEKVQGVDYSMVYYTKNESIHNSVYTRVPRKILRRIFNDIPEIGTKSFFDVGCGKGYSITVAAKKGFKNSGGIEYTKFLYDTCCSNLTKKHISSEKVFHGDAKEFDHYGDFDIFFFNNPFDETVIEPVAKRIFESCKNKQVYLYYLNPEAVRVHAIEKEGFKLVRQIPDKNEYYFNINVYSNSEGNEHN